MLIATASPNHRQTCQRQFALNDAQCARVLADPTLRLYLFGALEQPLAQYTRLDIAFPSQFEVRLNNAEIKANFKGLKNKPGSTRPADITEAIRKTPANQRNTLHVTYALTQKVGQPQEVESYGYLLLPPRMHTDTISRSSTCSSIWRRSSRSMISQSASRTATS
jgi:E3 SUMO-protein ligase PIAS1